MKLPTFHTLGLLFGLGLGVVHGTAEAGVIINGTRVVYPSQENEVIIRLDNKDDAPALVQAWLDDGDHNSTPATAKVPFLLTPPIFRMEARKGQALRMVYTKEPLPADRESLFWLNVLDIPPKAKEEAGSNTLQFAFRTRIKVFYRPQGLPTPVEAAPAALRWSFASEGGQRKLIVQNPTPYFVTLSDVRLGSAGEAAAATTAPVATSETGSDPAQDTTSGMVAPFERLSLPLPAEARGDTAHFIIVNDFGARHAHQAALGGGS